MTVNDKIWNSESAKKIVARLRKTYKTGKTHKYSWRIKQLKQLKKALQDNSKLISDAMAKDLGLSSTLTDFAEVRTKNTTITHCLFYM